jgi:hypothetical protein
MNEKKSTKQQHRRYIVHRSLVLHLGLTKALVLERIRRWENLNRKNQNASVFQEGKFWMYSTIERFVERDFPFWNVYTVRDALRELKKDGFIEVGNFNKQRGDRMHWYRVNEEKYQQLRKSAPDGKNEAILMVDTAWACALGLNESIVLCQLEHWLEVNAANDYEHRKEGKVRGTPTLCSFEDQDESIIASLCSDDEDTRYLPQTHFRAGTCWMWDSIEALTVLNFTIWSQYTTQRVLRSLESNGVISVLGKLTDLKSVFQLTIDYEMLDDYLYLWSTSGRPNASSRQKNARLFDGEVGTYAEFEKMWQQYITTKHDAGTQKELSEQSEESSSSDEYLAQDEVESNEPLVMAEASESSEIYVAAVAEATNPVAKSNEPSHKEYTRSKSIRVKHSFHSCFTPRRENSRLGKRDFSLHQEDVREKTARLGCSELELSRLLLKIQNPVSARFENLRNFYSSHTSRRYIRAALPIFLTARYKFPISPHENGPPGIPRWVFAL